MESNEKKEEEVENISETEKSIVGFDEICYENREKLIISRLCRIGNIISLVRTYTLHIKSIIIIAVRVVSGEYGVCAARQNWILRTHFEYRWRKIILCGICSETNEKKQREKERERVPCGVERTEKTKINRWHLVFFFSSLWVFQFLSCFSSRCFRFGINFSTFKMPFRWMRDTQNYTEHTLLWFVKSFELSVVSLFISFFSSNIFRFYLEFNRQSVCASLGWWNLLLSTRRRNGRRRLSNRHRFAINWNDLQR